MRRSITHARLAATAAACGVLLSCAVAASAATPSFTTSDQVFPAQPGSSRTLPAVDPTWTYQGNVISPDKAAQQELACMDDASLVTKCFQSEASLELAEARAGLIPGPGADGAVAAAARKLMRGKRLVRRGHASNHTGTSGPLSLWRDSPPGGWRVDTYSSCQWFDLPGSYGGNTSYANTGAHSAQLATGYGGGGYRAVLGSTYTNYDLVALGWNDAAYSRARGGIGCGIP